VLLVRRRMFCPSRWVIPGLAAGVNGMAGRPAGADGSRSSGRGQARVPM
jgi:hypothetical protein